MKQFSALVHLEEARNEGLTRIFHTDLLRKPESLMNTALDSDFDLSSVYSHSPASKSSPALSHQALRLPRHDQHEISGLTRTAFRTRSNLMPPKIQKLTFLLLGAYGIFLLPWKITTSEHFNKSESYALGFNNRVAVIWLLGTFLIAVLATLFLARSRPSKNYLEWITVNPILLPKWKEARSQYLILGAFSVWMTFEVFLFNHLLQFPYWGEATYFLKRIDLIALGFHPYADFQYLYGPLLLYLPFYLDRISGGFLGIENAYACSLALAYFLGFLGFFCYVQLFSLTKKERSVMLLSFYLMWIPISMGLNYAPLRFAMMLTVVALFHRLSLYQNQKEQRIFYGLLIFTALSIFLTFSISPEMGCVAIVALIAYSSTLVLQHRPWHLFNTLLGIATSLLLVLLFFSGFSKGMIIFFSGGNNFPIYPNAFNLTLLVAVTVILPLLATSFFQHWKDARAPLAAALIVAGMGMLPAALGRCDPGHVMFNEVLLFTLLFPAASFAGRTNWRALVAFYIFLIGLFYLFYWNHYDTSYKFAFSEPTFYSKHHETIDQWKKNWDERKDSSCQAPFLNWKKIAPYPEGFEVLDTLGKVAIPFDIDLSLDRFLKLKNYFSPFYNLEIDNLCLPQDTTALISSLLTYDAILLPENVTGCKDFPQSKDILTPTTSFSEQNEEWNIFYLNTKIHLPNYVGNRQLYEKEIQHLLSLLMIYPVHSKVIKDPFDPRASLVAQLLPCCEQIGSLPGWIIVKPKKSE